MSWRSRSNGISRIAGESRFRSISPRSWARRKIFVGPPRPVAEDLGPYLGRGEARSRPGGRRTRELNDGREAAPALVDVAEEREHVTPEAAGVGDGDGPRPAVVAHGREHEVVLARPAPVQHRDAGPGPGGDGLHGQLAEPDRDQFVPRGLEQRGLEFLAAPPLAPRARRPRGPPLELLCHADQDSRARKIREAAFLIGWPVA